jgi:hypothetical protein
MRFSARAALTLAPVLVAGTAQAHIALDMPTARYVYTDNGVEATPCGSGTKTNAVMNVTGGSSLTVNWHETINHDGHYRIGLSANESDFTVPMDLTIPSQPWPSWDLMDGIPDVGASAGTYSKTITVPDMSCPHCVLQVVQIASLTSNGGGNTGGYYTNYYSCADLNITATGTGSGGAGGGGGSNGGGGGSSGGGGGSNGGGGGSSGGGGGSTGGGGGSSGGGGGASGGGGGSNGGGGATAGGGGGSTGGGGSAGGTGGATATGGHTGSDAGTGGSSGDSGSGGGCSYGGGAGRGGVATLMLAGVLALLARRRRR